jgi:hypothetical protein
MIPLSEALVHGADSETLSLAAITQSPILDIHGYITDEFGQAYFVPQVIIFTDGTRAKIAPKTDEVCVLEAVSRREVFPYQLLSSPLGVLQREMDRR